MEASRDPLPSRASTAMPVGTISCSPSPVGRAVARARARDRKRRSAETCSDPLQSRDVNNTPFRHEHCEAHAIRSPAATLTPDFARSTRLPGTTLPSLIGSSTAAFRPWRQGGAGAGFLPGCRRAATWDSTSIPGVEIRPLADVACRRQRRAPPSLQSPDSIELRFVARALRRSFRLQRRNCLNRDGAGVPANRFPN
jgi:hypothetical protein